MEQAQPSGQYQAVPAASFQVGQQLPFAVYEPDEVLLLQRGSVITPRFHRNLRDRKLAEVYVRTEDIEQLEPKALENRDGLTCDYETDATRALEETSLEDRVAQGQAFIESFQPREAVPYNSELVAKMVQTRDNDVEDLSEKLADLATGSSQVDCESFKSVSANYIWHLAQDLDATLAVAQLPQGKDYLANHSLEMSVMGMALASQLRLTRDEVHITGISGLLHDIGMTKVPRKLIDARRRLETLEFLEVTRHPAYTVDMSERILGVPQRARIVVYQVHERHNGTGYPRRRVGARTFLIAKVLGIVDAYLAMISDRPYRKGMLPYHAMERLLHEARQGVWDPAVMRAFLALIGLFPVGSFVMLSDESMAKIIRAGGENFAKPHVTITHNPDGVPQSDDTVIDLAEEKDLTIAKAIPRLYDLA